MDAPNLHEALRIPIRSGHRAEIWDFKGRNPVFDRTVDRVTGLDLACEDQCSAYHYFDLFEKVEVDHEALTRIVDLGVFMGGSSAVLAGCVEPMGLELDLVDANADYLQFTCERLRRTFPGAVPRVRMFHGDLPTYTAEVLSAEPRTRALVHHDGAHDFEQVVKDVSALWFVRDRVHALAVHDTHLRGGVTRLNFVDAAVHAVFGPGVPHEGFGARFPHDAPVTAPNEWDGNYFLADQPEGMYIRFEGVEWRYPHPSMTLDDFLPTKAAPSA